MCAAFRVCIVHIVRCTCYIYRLGMAVLRTLNSHWKIDIYIFVHLCVVVYVYDVHVPYDVYKWLRPPPTDSVTVVPMCLCMFVTYVCKAILLSAHIIAVNDGRRTCASVFFSSVISIGRFRIHDHLFPSTHTHK